MSCSKILQASSLLSALKAERKKRRAVVFTNGCFDILHLGHVRYLQKARSLGDVLVVAINTDTSVRTLKGPDRPINSQRDRAEVLASLEAVNYVTFFSENTPEALIQKVRPDFLVKGGDWKPKDIAGGSYVLSYGGKVRSLPYIKGRSTTGILEKLLAS